MKTRKTMEPCKDCGSTKLNEEALYCDGCWAIRMKPQPHAHTPTTGKMREILLGLTHDGDVNDHTIMVALESSDDPLRAYIVRAVNSHEELCEAVVLATELLEGIRDSMQGQNPTLDKELTWQIDKNNAMLRSIAKTEKGV